jgi:diketogulonate reductase-like aldo/keto reductase
MRTLSLSTGGEMPVLGLGTWRMGEDASRRAAEVKAVREAIVLGYRLIDTAEMYGEGGAESVLGQAIGEALRAGDVRREALFVVSKVHPHNASRSGTRAACERSLQRLGLDAIDLYLLHWRGNHPLRDTVAAMQSLVADGRIAHWGVSNFDTADMQELARTVGDGPGCAANQVYLSLGERGPEFDLLPWQRERGMPLMAYSPIDQGALAEDDGLAELAARLGVTAAQLALAAVIARSGVAAIPKAVRSAHLKENLAAAELKLDAATLEALDRLHPPPRRKRPLSMI